MTVDIAQWKSDVLIPLCDHTGGEPDPRLQPVLDQEVVELLSADTDRTQDYVFESVKLPEIRGASELLETLNVEEIPLLFDQHGLPRESILARGGGSLLALVPPGYGAMLAAEIERLYPERTGAATITCDWRQITPRMLLEGYPPDGQAPFGSLVRWASTWLRRRKEDKPPGPFYEAPPHAARCRSCKQRPAHKIYQYPDGEKLPICTICHHKMEWIGRRPGKWEWIREFNQGLSPEQRRRYYQNDQYTFDQVKMAQDLSDIGQACQARRGYIGFIYLDGDGVGEYILNRPTAKAYTKASTDLPKAALQAVRDAIVDAPLQVTKVNRPDQPDPIPIHPFEIITVGGDDVLLIVPADVALPIAARTSEGFRERMAGDDQVVLTMSAGVVIADDHNPVQVLLQLSKELLRSAKRVRRQHGGVQPGMVDFHVLLSQDMLAEKVGNVRGDSPYKLSEINEHGRKVNLRLLGRPYTAPQVLALWKALQELAAKGFSKSQMHRLGEVLMTGRRSSTLFYAYQKARRDTADAYEALDKVIRAARSLDDRTDPEPWFEVEDDPCYKFGTALWDIAELYDFVPKSGGEE
jgi:hypothetical protein